MPSKAAARRAEQRKREGKAPTTQAGEFVREEMHHAKEGRHSARNPKQAIAIGLSQARRAGVDVKPPKKGKTSPATRKKAERDYERGASKRAASTRKRAASTTKRKATAKRTAASGARPARKRTPSKQSKATRKAAPRKAVRKTATKKAAGTRAPSKRKASARKSR